MKCLTSAQPNDEEPDPAACSMLDVPGALLAFGQPCGRAPSPSHAFMRLRSIVTAVLAVLSAIGCTSDRALHSGASYREPALRRELLAMVEADQRVRKGITLPMTPEKLAQMDDIDARHTATMRKITTAHGWPGRSLVGEDGAHAAWLLVQHADASFMAECLPLMKQAASRDEASPKDYAYLLDRVLMKEGKPQVYGTQFTSDADGKLVAHPIEAADQVDDRRRAIGLPPMAEYERKIREVYK